MSASTLKRNRMFGFRAAMKKNKGRLLNDRRRKGRVKLVAAYKHI
jgi:ribosomal protein L34